MTRRELSATAPSPILLTLLALALAALPALAQDPPAAEEPEPRWTGKAGLAFVATGGNTDTENFGFDFLLERRPEPWGLELKALLHRAEEDGLRTAERYHLGLRGQRALGEKWDLFAGIAGEQDEFAGLDLRTLVEAGFIFHALRGERHKLSFDLGATWTDEDQVPPAPDVSYLGAVVGFAYEWRFSDTAKMTERLLVYPNFDDSDDWRLDWTIAVTAALTSRLAVQVGYELRYRHQPVSGRDDTDTATKMSLVLNL